MKKIYILLSLFTFSTLLAKGQQHISTVNVKNNFYVQYKMGLDYKRGKGVKQNMQHAFKCLHKSAQKGHTPAQYEFALMFHYGEGVRKNAELARLWFTRAAKKGHPLAQEILYRFYSGVKPYKSLNRLRYSRLR